MAAWMDSSSMLQVYGAALNGAVPECTGTPNEMHLCPSEHSREAKNKRRSRPAERGCNHFQNARAFPPTIVDELHDYRAFAAGRRCAMRHRQVPTIVSRCSCAKDRSGT